jgi:hypothetical protein
MRATLWIAASGLLLASTSAFAADGERPVNDGGTAYVEESGAPAPGAADMTQTQTDQAAQTSAPHVSKAQPAQPSSRAQAGTSQLVRTMSPDDPAWDQVHQGG